MIAKVVSVSHMTKDGCDLKVLMKKVFITYSSQHSVNSIKLKGLQIGRHIQGNVNSTTADVVGADVFVNQIWNRQDSRQTLTEPVALGRLMTKAFKHNIPSHYTVNQSKASFLTYHTMQYLRLCLLLLKDKVSSYYFRKT